MVALTLSETISQLLSETQLRTKQLENKFSHTHYHDRACVANNRAIEQFVTTHTKLDNGRPVFEAERYYQKELWPLETLDQIKRASDYVVQKAVRR